MESKYCSVIYQNSNKLKNNVNQILKQSSTFNQIPKSLTFESNTTRLDTITSETEEDDMDVFIANFLKDKYKILNEYPKDNLNNKNNIINKWKVLINVIIVIIRMKKIKIKNLSLSNISEIFNKKMPIQNKNKFKNSIIEEKEKDKEMSYILDQIKLFQLVKYGYDKYEEDIIKLLKKNNFVNEPNYQEFTPLYLACLNGHENIVKILLDNGANFLLLNSNNESILDVSVRWNYYNLTKFLLFYCKWPYTYIRNAYKLIKNKKIKQLFRIYRNNNISCLH
jgi:hypothetical protein